MKIVSTAICICMKKGPRPKYVLDNSKKCLCLGNFGILSVGLSVCSASTAYNSLCRGLNYLLKVRYIILTWPDF